MYPAARFDCVFKDAPVVAENAIETPTGPGIKMHHMVTFWLARGQPGSGIRHILNGTGPGAFTLGKKTMD